MNSDEVTEKLTNDVWCLGMFINIDQSAVGYSLATEWITMYATLLEQNVGAALTSVV